MKYFLQQVGFIGKMKRIAGNSACKSRVDSMRVMKWSIRSWKWWNGEGNKEMYGHNMVLVNEHDEQKVFWEASLVAIHVAIEFELWNIGIHMVFTSISPFFMSSIHFQIEIKSSRVTHACTDLLLLRTCKSLALAYSKTWDHGGRDVFDISSSNTYEEKNNKQLLIKQIQGKMNEANSIYTRGRVMAH